MTKEIYWCYDGRRLLICERNGILVAVWKPEVKNKTKTSIVTTKEQKDKKTTKGDKRL